MTLDTLHIINKPASNTELYQDCLASCSSTDALVLIEAAVYSACSNQSVLLSRFPIPIYALAIDAQARGIQDKISDQVTLIDDATFVDLCCQHQKSISWF